jgi:hypothetical protein
MYLCMYVRMYVCGPLAPDCSYIHVCQHSMYVCMYVCVCVCVCKCVHVNFCTCMCIWANNIILALIRHVTDMHVFMRACMCDISQDAVYGIFFCIHDANACVLCLSAEPRDHLMSKH